MNYKVLVLKSFDSLDENNCFVDETMLHKGLYKTSVPVLHSKTISIEKLIEMRRFVLDIDKQTDFWIENIQKCKMIEVELKLV
jgi:hypothetical protein